MINKNDWDKSKERFSAFWQNDVADRFCFSVRAPKGAPPFRLPKDPYEKWMNTQYRFEEALYNYSNTFYGGEAFPLFWNNLGPGVAAAFMGSGFKLADDTVWFDSDPIIEDWDNIPDIEFDQESIMWKKACELTEMFVKNADGRYHVGITDLGGNMDIAVSLRGNEKLLYDVIDRPEAVKSLLDRIDDIWYRAYNKLQTIIEGTMEGSSAWMGIWCEKRWYPLQCDFSAMISKAMFDEFVCPRLEKEAGFFDHSIYHLDGPGQIAHLDSLLDISKINGIQCVPGDILNLLTGKSYGVFCTEKWIPVYQKIQKSGKNLVLTGVSPGEVEQLLKHLTPKGLFISTCCDNPEDAKALLEQADRWSAQSA